MIIYDTKKPSYLNFTQNLSRENVKWERYLDQHKLTGIPEGKEKEVLDSLLEIYKPYKLKQKRIFINNPIFLSNLDTTRIKVINNFENKINNSDNAKKVGVKRQQVTYIIKTFLEEKRLLSEKRGQKENILKKK